MEKIPGIKHNLDTSAKELTIEAKKGFDVQGALAGLTKDVKFFEGFEIKN